MSVAKAPSRAPLAVLVVDDDRDSLIAVQAVLAGVAEEVVVAHSGREALTQLLERDFAVILMDAKMPELDGFATAELIRTRPRTRLTPIIFLTGWRAEGDLFKAYDMGAVDYLFKPVVPQVLRAKVRFFLQLAQSSRDLARAHAELEQFAAIASHDLKEPLRTISSYTELLARRLQGSLDETARQYLEFAGQGARRLHQLIDDLLQYARLGAAEPPQREGVDLQTLAESVVASLRAMVEQHQAVIEYGALPRARGNPLQVRQLLQNLLVNALKFSPPPARVEIFGAAENGMAHVQVRDHGIGFDMRFHDRIFVPFQRLHGRDEYSGTGIGLALCKKIVEIHGGRIWAQAAPGAGATLHFTLPAAGKAEEA
ncbi:MAG: sensor histidine kinase [Terriglobales bacterium]